MSIHRIDADIQAFSARLGMLYQPTENINVAASYEFPSVLAIDESYNTELISTFDNGVQFTDDAPVNFCTRSFVPSVLISGATAKNLRGFTVSASAEAVQYSNGEIRFDGIGLSDLERSINGTVCSNLNDVINLRGGIEYQLNDRFTPRLGYAYFPSPQKGIDSQRQFINGGFSAELTKGLMFDLGVQYSFWDDQNELYSTSTTSEVVSEKVTRLHVMAGLRMSIKLLFIG
ncbi:MAG: outer membrane protein transport protein [Fodinibius sp.]|nr:outer membrane protein transport protein [Fodinibius sp.]